MSISPQTMRARAEIAKIATLRDLPRLTASFDITREGADAMRIDGEVSATVGQNCVVTLEPIENKIREGIDLVFASPAKGSIADEEGKITVDFNDPDSDRADRAKARSISAPSRPNFFCSASIPIRARKASCSTRRRLRKTRPSTPSPRLRR